MTNHNHIPSVWPCGYRYVLAALRLRETEGICRELRITSPIWVIEAATDTNEKKGGKNAATGFQRLACRKEANGNSPQERQAWEKPITDSTRSDEDFPSLLAGGKNDSRLEQRGRENGCREEHRGLHVDVHAAARPNKKDGSQQDEAGERDGELPRETVYPEQGALSNEIGGPTIRRMLGVPAPRFGGRWNTWHASVVQAVKWTGQRGSNVMEWIDGLIHGGDIGLIVGAAMLLWRIKGYLDRYENMWREFPPHRHVNGKIMYSQDYPPAVTEQITAGD